MSDKLDNTARARSKPFYVTVKQFGLALKEGWSWIIYPLLLMLCFKLYGIETATISSILKGLTSLVGKYLFKPK